MKAVIRGHPRDRMRQRGITKEQVQRVIDDPESQTYDPVKVSIRLERALGERTLIVWVRAPFPPASDTVVVKSCAWKGA